MLHAIAHTTPVADRHDGNDRTGTRELGLDGWLTFVEGDFFDLSAAEHDNLGGLDLVWLDAGSPSDDARFISTLWPAIRPGGLLLVHEPLTSYFASWTK